jgi:tRNA(Ile)-lysidine synthetase-like protein
VHSLAERVISHIRRQELLAAGDRVGAAVSGGIDSVALLRVLLELRGELGIVLSVVHFNHRLRGAESDADQEFVAGLAREFDLQFYIDGDDVAERAREDGVSVEAAARELRYGFFRSLIGEGAGGEARGLKPDSHEAPVRGAKGPLFHDTDQNRGPEEAFFHGAAPSRDPEGPLSHEGPPFLGASIDKIVTGHTLDDQAETVLMRMIRGAGVRGLGGIHPRVLVEDDDGEISGEIVRPLLGVRRRELEQYLKDIGQSWREDSSNADERFTRNRVRKLVVPLLEQEFNPAVAENLAELAEIARGEEDYWENEVAGWMGTTVQWSEPEWARVVPVEKNLVQIAGIGTPSKRSGSTKIPTSRAKDAREMGHPGINDSQTNHPESNDLQSRIDGAPWLVMNASVSRMWFLGEPVAVQRRLVKAIGENVGIPLEFKHVEEILRIAGEDGPSGKELSLPLGWKVVLQPEALIFLTPDLREPAPPQDYEYEVPVPGRIVIHEAGLSFEARSIPAGGDAGYNPDHLLDAESLPRQLRVRNWRPGDRFWPVHTKSPKKIKELLQERHVAQPERKSWPVVVSGDEIVWLRGFPVPAKYRGKPGQAAVLIAESPLAPESTEE